MSQKLFFIYLLIIMKHCASCYITAGRQKMIFSLSKELFVKNILLIKENSFVTDTKIISFVKSLSQSKIYISCLTAGEMKSIMDGYINSKIIFSKTLILTFNEEFNTAIYELISRDETIQSKYLWLIWNNENRLMQQNDRFYIPYNSQLLIVKDNIKDISLISEMYHPRIFSQVLFRRHFGSWSENKGIKVPEKDLYKRRIDMNGTVLNVMFYPENVPTEKWIECLIIISEMMNFRGLLISEAKLIELIEHQEQIQFEIDFRLVLFDNSVPEGSQILGLIWKTGANMYIRYDEILMDHGIGTYTRPFSKQLWWAILISIASLGLSTLILVYKSSSDFSILSALYHPLEAFMNQDGCETPKSKSIRIAVITARLVAMFIVPAYSGLLLTYILVPNVELPFTDIKGFVQDGTYELGFSSATHFHLYFTNTKDIWSKTAYEKYLLKPNEMPKNDFDLFDKICDYKKVSFIILGKKFPITRCKVIKIPTPILSAWSGFKLRQDSPYTRIFNRIAKSILSSGINNRYEKKSASLLQIYSYRDLDRTDEKNSVGIQSIKPVLLMLALLYALSVIMLLLEYFCKRLKPHFTFKKFKLKKRRHGVFEKM